MWLINGRRILRQAGLADTTDGTFRRRGSKYDFIASNAARAMAAIGMPVRLLKFMPRKSLFCHKRCSSICRRSQLELTALRNNLAAHG